MTEDDTVLSRDWFIWAFDSAMAAAVRIHGDAARLAAYDGRIAFEQQLPRGESYKVVPRTEVSAVQ